MTSTTTTATKSHICRRCGRGLRSAKSVALGYGPTCFKRMLAEAAAKAQASGKGEQMAKAVELIRDGGIVPLRPRVWRTVASKGTATYLTAVNTCNCMAGLRGRACYHQMAAQLMAS